VGSGPARARPAGGATRRGRDAPAAGPDPDARLAGIRACTEAGFDEVYISQAGGEHEGFFEFYANTVLPRLRDS